MMQRFPRRYVLAAAVLVALVVAAGCAKYNTFYNARKAFDQAERIREEKLRKGDDVSKPTPQQVQAYQRAVQKCQKLINEYPGHGLTDDALFLMAKAYHRMQSYRMSSSKLELLLLNFPTTEYLEEALYLQALNHMFIGDITGADDYLDRLQREFPGSEYRSEALRISGENALGRERWQEAADDFRSYLRQFPDAPAVDKVRSELGQALWHLEAWQEADTVLAGIGGANLTQEEQFRARLLRARCLVRLGRDGEADSLLDVIQPEAEMFQADGLVALVRAELLIGRGQDDDAAALLENMPQEWRNSEVNARTGELLGEIYLRRWDLEEAQKRFREAIHGRKVLNDPDRCDRLNNELGRYLLLDTRLETAKEPKASRMKLSQANVLLFALDRPRLALDRFREIIEVASDSSAVVRALYGAALVYRQHLSLPDSAALYEQRLESEFPDSPQAFQLRHGRGADLFGYLRRLQQEMVAAARDSAAAASAQAAPAPDQAAAAMPSPTGSPAPADTVTADVAPVPVRQDTSTAPPPAGTGSTAVDTSGAGEGTRP